MTRALQGSCAALIFTALGLCAAASFAQPVDTGAVTTRKIEWETQEKTIVPNGARILDLDTFDTNGDGVITRREIGDKLFHIFDRDGNGLIDNLEYEKKLVATVVPTRKTTKITYIPGDDGVTDKTVITSEEFMKKTQLSRFDASGKGLSPHEFLGMTFEQVDVSRDRFIDINEWRGAYIASIDAKNRQKELYRVNP